MGQKLRAYARAMAQAVGCLFDHHEYVLDTQAVGVMRLRCLHCGRVTLGVTVTR